MDYIHPLHSRLTRHSKHAEARLCFRNGAEKLPDAEESAQAGKEITGNKNIKEAFEHYYTIISLTPAYKHLENPVDRSYFYALLLQGMLRTQNIRMAPIGAPALMIAGTLPALQSPLRFDYKDIKREQLDIADPFGLAKSLKGKDAERVKEAQTDWKKDEKINRAVLEYNIDAYMNWRIDLDNLLRANGLPPPADESVELPDGNRRLQRSEYFEMLTLYSRGEGGTLEKAMQKYPPNSLRGLREFLGSKEIQKQLEQPNTMRTDLLVDEMGPAEFLNEFGVKIDIHLHHEYLAQRRGGKPSSTGEVPDAAVWEQDPMRAYVFLQTVGFRAGGQGNSNFLDALWFYYDPTIVQEEKDPEYTHGMSQQDVRVILSQIVQRFLVADTMASQSLGFRQELGEDISFNQRVKGEADKAINVVKDWRNNWPLVIAMGVSSYIILKWLHRVLWKDEHTNLFHYMVYGTIIGGTLAMYQKYQGKESWPEALLRKGSDAFEKEKKEKDPTKRKTAMMWAKKLELKDSRKELCLAALQTAPINQVVGWYEQMRFRERNGMPTDPDKVNKGSGDILQAEPIDVPSNWTEGIDNQFGTMNERQKSVLFFQTLKAFFKKQGERLRVGGWGLPEGNKFDDDEAIGFDYINSIFVKRQYFTVMARQVLASITKQTGGITIDITGLDPNDPRRKAVEKMLREKLGPDKAKEVIVQIEVYRNLIMQEQKDQSTASYPFYYALVGTMDESMVSRAGRDGTGPGGIFRTLQFQTKRLEDKYVFTPLSETAREAYDKLNETFGKKKS